jgi:DNA-binding CsgD family transcriptional regulator
MPTSSIVDNVKTMDTSLSLAEFSDLIEAIYQGPLEAPPWKTFLGLLRIQMHVAFATLVLLPASCGQPMLTSTSGPQTDAALDAYNGRFFEIDPFLNLPRNQVVVASELVGVAKWFSGDFYKEFLKPLDIQDLLGMDSVTPDGAEIRLRVTKSHDSPPFGDRDRAFFELIMPHLKLAVHLRAHLDGIDIERNFLARTIQSMQIGTVLLDAQGSILSINDEAKTILDECDGLKLVGGKLEAEYSSENSILQRLTLAAYSASKSKVPTMMEAVAITRPSARSKLTVMIRAIPATEWSEGWRRARVAIFLRDPERKPQGSLEIIRDLFGLTFVEGWLALLMAQGRTLDEASEQLNIRRNTARAHLRSIFSKMGVTRQAELVRQVLNSVIQIG